MKDRLEHMLNLSAELGENLVVFTTEMRHLQRELMMARQDAESDGTITVDPRHAEGTDHAVDRGRQAVKVAMKEWERGVCEPGTRGMPAQRLEASRQRIDTYIRGDQGLTWTSANTDDLSKPTPYKRDGDFSWCGAFAAYCYGALGLDRQIRRSVMPSCRRLKKWAEGSKRLLDPFDKPLELQRGDVLVVGRAGSRYGDHITLVREVLETGQGRILFRTVEGNANGQGRDGDEYEGVVLQERPLLRSTDREYAAHYAVRFLAGDFS